MKAPTLTWIDGINFQSKPLNELTAEERRAVLEAIPLHESPPTPMTDEQKMMPCPFCGGSARMTEGYWSNGGTWRTPVVLCKSCPVEMHAGRKVGDPDALTVWNKRLPPEGGEAKPAAWVVRYLDARVDGNAVTTSVHLDEKDAQRTVANAMSRAALLDGKRVHVQPLYARAILSDTEGDGAADPTADARWNNGCDFALEKLCKFLGVETDSVNWDAATETVDGDVMAVIGNILRAKYGDDFDRKSVFGYERGVNDMREAAAKIAREMKSGPIYYVDGKPNSRAVMGGDLIADQIRALPSPATISTGSAK